MASGFSRILGGNGGRAHGASDFRYIRTELLSSSTDLLMNWLTAIFGLLGVYCLAGLVYTWMTLGTAGGAEGIRFWSTLLVLALIAAPVNEWRARRRRPREDPPDPGTGG
jgi:hypothetical protein